MKIRIGILAAGSLLGVALAQKPEEPAIAPPASPSSTTTGSESANAAIPELKTRTMKGVLLDTACAGAGGGEAKSTFAKETKTTGEADRTAPSAAGENSNPSCGVSTGTSRFALRLKDGRTLPFDSVGNDRALAVVKSKKKWEQAASSGKPIQASVSGAEVADKLTVMSIH